MKNIVFIFLFLFCIHSLDAMPFSDWAYETGNGSTIGDTGGGVGLLTNTNTELYNLTKWYFYKDHIIGEYEPDINDDTETAYFILNELNGDLKTYDNKDLFENNLIRQQLVPICWTRWYNDHSQFMYLMCILWLFYSPIMICFILFVVLLIFQSFILKNKFLKISCIVLTSIFLAPPLLFILNDYYTTSI